MKVECHCGDVTLTLPHRPDQILQCNCSICCKSGFRGVYYPDGEVQVSGALDGYVRSDIKDPFITMWRCRRCGILTHWTLLEAWPHDDVPRPNRMGINARLLDAELAADLPVQHSDGASQ